MADTRTLKLALLADVNKFISGMNDADNSTKDLNSKIGKYSKAMAKSFALAAAAAGAYAIKLGVDSVNAAIEDEKSQRILAIQMEKTVGANENLIASVEDYISATQLRVGVQDDKLRPSFARLLRSTKDVAEAQKLLNLALDISVATGKEVDAVSMALGKAYDGNTASLGKLGLGVDSAILKSGDLDLIMGTLTKTFGGFADREAKSFDGQLRIVNIRIDELKENIGKNLLPVLGDMLVKVNEAAKGFSGEDPKGLSARAIELGANLGDTGAYSLGRSIKTLTDSFGKLFEALTTSNANDANSTLQTFANALNAVAGGINAIASAYSKAKSVGGKILDLLDLGMGQGEAFGPGGKYNGILNPNNPNFLGGRAIGGPVSGTNSYLVGENGPEVFTPNVGGKITSNGMGGGTVINLNGILDAESARRSIEQLIQRSARRTGAIDWVGATL